MIKKYSEDINYYIDMLHEFAKVALPANLFNMLKIDNFEHLYEEDKIRIIKAILQALKFFYLEKPELRKSAIDYDKNIAALKSNFFYLADSLKDLSNSCEETKRIIKKII